MAPDEEYLVLASDIPARSYAATPALFRGARAVKRQLAEAPGLVGFSLLARPLRKQYASLSVWTDEAALAGFARSDAHGRLMEELRPAMAPTTFVRWTIDGSQGRPSWREALRRLSAARGERGEATPTDPDPARAGCPPGHQSTS